MSGRIAVDTNVLMRFIARDDEAQAQAAASVLASADAIVVSNVVFTEAVWVLRRVYRFPRADVAGQVRWL